MTAVISDIHGNLEALTAVLADIARQGVVRAVNLGDTLVYGPDPLACLELTRGFDVNLLGHFDHALLHPPDGFPAELKQTVTWTRSQLESTPAGVAHLAALAGVSSICDEGDVTFAHGSPSRPLYDFVFPEDIYCAPKMQCIGEYFVALAFVGSSHVPGVFTEVEAGRWAYASLDEWNPGAPVTGRKVLVTVGSVGQPRDGDPRACYVLFDGEGVWFRRVEYDFATTARKIRAAAELPDFFAARLADGR